MPTATYDKLIDINLLSTFKDKADLLYAKDADLTALDAKVDQIISTGGEPNVIETVKVNNSALTPDANKAVNVTIAESTSNGKVKVNGTDISIHGLKSAAYTESNAYDASGAAAAVLGSSSDSSSAKTVYGAIALANTKTSNTGTVTNVSGTSPISVSNQTTTPVVSIQAASATQDGYMTSAQFSKLAGIAEGATANVGTVTNVSGTAPISVSNQTSTPTVSIAAASAQSAGSMSSAHYSKLEGIAAGATANAATTTTPKMDGTAAVGTETAYAKGDHVHPTDTSRAPLASPTFTGTPAAPTAAAGTNTTQIATTAFVQTAVANAVGNAFQGVITSNTAISSASYKKGMFWVVGAAGTYVGQTCEIGDAIYAIKDKASSYAAGDFTVVQTNIDVTLLVKYTDITLATTAEVEALFAA